MKLCLLLASLCLLPTSAAAADQNDSWLMYGKNYSAWRYSDAAQINAGNVSRLAPRWIFQSGAGALESTPLVFDG
jgi:glucose dehydrogenase